MKRAHWVGLLVACFLVGPPALAQPKREPGGALAASLSGDARKAYDAARTLFGQGEFVRALGALEQAHRLSPDPRLFWNMAACEQKLGRYASAIRHVERYRTGAATMLSDNEKREADEFVAAAVVYVGTVNVASNVDGTQIFVDDELLGTTPLPKPIVVDEGNHRVRFSRGGHRSVERTERVPAGAQLRWIAELEREPSVNVAPPPTRSADAMEDRPDRRPSRVGPLLLAGGGLLVAGGGTFLVTLAHDEAKSIEADCGPRCPPSRWESEQTRERVGDVLLGVGLAAVVAGVIWWVLRP
jgi:hypothetical protein